MRPYSAMSRKRDASSRDLADGGIAIPGSLSLVTPLEESRAAKAQASRRKCFLHLQRQLNNEFAIAVRRNADSQYPLANEALDYIKFVTALHETFKDVLQPPAAPAPRGGAVFVVGSGDFGQLGLGEEVAEKKRPGLLDAFDGAAVAGLACGGMHTLALTVEGRVYSWGVNDEGALGREARSLRTLALMPLTPPA